MKYLSKTKQILLVSIVLVIAAFAAYIMLFLAIKEKNNSISILTNEASIVLQEEIKLRSVEYLIKDTLKERTVLDSYFIADDDIINFIETIENLGADSGAKIEIISVSVNDKDVKAADKINISELLNLNFKIEGRFAQMFHFLSMLEKLPFKIDILRMSFEKVSDDAGEIDKSLEPWEGSFSITAVKLK